MIGKFTNRFFILLQLLALTALLISCSSEEKQKKAELEKAIQNISNLDNVQTAIEKQVLSEAIVIIRKHAANGNMEAMYWMSEGRLLDKTDPNYVSVGKAIDWLKKAAAKGHVDACLTLADLYAGNNPVKDLNKAYMWYYIGYYKKDGGKVHALNTSKNPIEGDFRNESRVDTVVKELGHNKVLEIEKQAKAWLAKNHK